MPRRAATVDDLAGHRFGTGVEADWPPFNLELSMTSIQPSRLLTAALWLDVVASAPLALLQTFAPDRLAGWVQLPQAPLFHTGWVMLAYVALLLVLLRLPHVPLWLLRGVIVGNVAWAAVALGLMLTVATGPAGLVLLALHLSPALFAGLQQRGLSQSRSIGPLRTAGAH
jgi:hypothetical protein